MFTMLRSAVVALGLMTAGILPAAAQQTSPAPVEQAAPAAAQKPVLFSLTMDQIGAVAIGAVAGSVLLNILGGGTGHLTGAVIGGVVGYWYYTQPAAEAQGG